MIFNEERRVLISNFEFQISNVAGVFNRVIHFLVLSKGLNNKSEYVIQ